ncbi:hypothetical protein LWI29_037494 [Acer saccharum]|uniref:Peptidase S26 domain-containing protein n=1 Tax=Acer saccharum TaxID=4024 RepID=A0AA39SG37_ACESA|nr:hypothetical protein LWI29_037494 [Acer saccharum]
MGVRNNVTVFLNFAKEGFDKAVLVGKLFCCVHVVNTYFCSVVLAYGPSMLPTISTSSSLLLAERVSHRFNKVGPGDIVILRSPEVPRKVLTKRVIGLEGDRVTYVVDPNNSDKSDTVVVPKGHIWIEGDNIYNSYDSRNFGAVPLGLLQGKVFWRIWPPKDFGSLRRRAE